MNKRGQFYLLFTIIIVTMIAGFATITNYSQKKPETKINYLGQELQIEGEKMIDYSIRNSLNPQLYLTDFTYNYSNYSEASNLYFLFGNTNTIRVAGYKRLSGGTITLEGVSGTNNLVLNQNQYSYSDFTPSGASINMTIDGTKYKFTLLTGENFYFVISEQIDNQLNVNTNGN